MTFQRKYCQLLTSQPFKNLVNIVVFIRRHVVNGFVIFMVLGTFLDLVWTTLGGLGAPCGGYFGHWTLTKMLRNGQKLLRLVPRGQKRVQSYGDGGGDAHPCTPDPYNIIGRGIYTYICIYTFHIGPKRGLGCPTGSPDR